MQKSFCRAFTLNLLALAGVLLASYTVVVPLAHAQQVGWGWVCDDGNEPAVTVTNQGNGHLVSWSCEANSSLNTELSGYVLKGYEVEYSGEPQNLTFGATGDSWLDDITGHRLLKDYTARCDPSSYFVRAITKKKQGTQLISQDIYATGKDLCNSTVNQAPIAVIDSPEIAYVDVPFTLSAANSSDPDGDTLTFGWTLTSPSAEVTESTDETWSFTAKEEGPHDVKLAVSDGQDTVDIQIVIPVEATVGQNQPPVVSAGSSATVTLTEAGIASYTLNGTYTDDGLPINGNKSELWSVTCEVGDCGQTVTITDTSDPNSGVTLYELGNYTFTFTVSDGEEVSFDQMVIQVVESTGGLGLAAWVGESSPTVPNSCQQTTFDRTFGNLLWETNFDNDAVDWYRDENGVQRWNTAYAWGPETIINNESQYYVDELNVHPNNNDEWSPIEHVVENDNGYLVIQAAPTELADRNGLGPAGSTQDYLSGVITSRGQVDGDLTYGYFEARLRTAPGNGTWSAFWLNHSAFRRTNEPEADIIEYLGQSKTTNGVCPAGTSNSEAEDATDRLYCRASHPAFIDDADNTITSKGYNTYDTQYHTYWFGRGRREERTELHYTNRDYDPEVPGISDEWCGSRINFAEEFHVYGFYWSPTEMIWTIDDIIVMELKAATSPLPIADENMYLVLNLALGNDLLPWESWPGAPDDWTHSQFNVSGVNKVSMAIDYVKVYNYQ